MIERYALPEIAGLFTDEARFATWLEVEILASEAWAKLGVVPAEDAVAIRERAGFTLDEIRQSIRLDGKRMVTVNRAGKRVKLILDLSGRESPTSAVVPPPRAAAGGGAKAAPPRK